MVYFSLFKKVFSKRFYKILKPFVIFLIFFVCFFINIANYESTNVNFQLRVFKFKLFKDIVVIITEETVLNKIIFALQTDHDTLNLLKKINSNHIKIKGKNYEISFLKEIFYSPTYRKKFGLSPKIFSQQADDFSEDKIEYRNLGRYIWLLH